MTRRRGSPWLGAAVAGVCLLACTVEHREPTDPSGEPFPYQVPPEWTMQVDSSELSEPDSIDSPGLTCYQRTGELADYLDRVLRPKLSLAATTVAACLRERSRFDGDVTWTWEASGVQAGSAWTAKLRAFVVSPDSIIWWEHVTGAAAHLEDFYCLYGYSDGDASAGFWQYYHWEFPDQQVRLVESRWSRQPGNGEIRSARFDIFAWTSDSAPQGPGEWASYGLSDSVETLIYHDLSDIEDNGTFTAQWDLRTGAGRWHRSTFSSGEMSCCWGPRPERADQDCP